MEKRIIPSILVTLRYKLMLQFPGHFGDQNDRKKPFLEGFLAFALLKILSYYPASGSLFVLSQPYARSIELGARKLRIKF